MLSRSLLEKDPCYSATIFALCEAMFNNRKDYIERPSPSLYVNYPGPHLEDAWNGLEVRPRVLPP